MQAPIPRLPVWRMAPETYDGIPRADWVPKTNRRDTVWFWTSLNCQQVWSALSQLTYSQPTTQRLARRAPIYPSRLQAIDTSNSSASARKNADSFCKLSLHQPCVSRRNAEPLRARHALHALRSARAIHGGVAITTRATASRAGRVTRHRRHADT